jgi:alkylated DNA repair dioxygenase AlkB
MTWLQNGGREALFAYLLAYDTTTFDPAAAAPMTASKNELVDHARSDLSGWVSFFLANLELELHRLAEYLQCKPTDLDLVLNKHLKWLYDPQNTTRVTPNGLGRELSRFGLKTVGPIPSVSFGKQRFYILRNHKKWLHMPPKDIADYVDGVFPPEMHLQKF